MTEPAFRCRVYGAPVAWMRPRATRAGGFIRFFTHPHIEDWKRTVVAQVLPSKPAAMIEGPLSVRMVFYLLRPATLPKKVRFHAKKPDSENLAKCCLDFLSMVVYRDDAQVTELYVRKEYSDEPGVDIEICLMETPTESKPAPAAQEAMGL